MCINVFNVSLSSVYLKFANGTKMMMVLYINTVRYILKNLLRSGLNDRQRYEYLE